jgi:hypothetical protein
LQDPVIDILLLTVSGSSTPLRNKVGGERITVKEQKDPIGLMSVNVDNGPGIYSIRLQHINRTNIELLGYCGNERRPRCIFEVTINLAARRRECERRQHYQ